MQRALAMAVLGGSVPACGVDGGAGSAGGTADTGADTDPSTDETSVGAIAEPSVSQCGDATFASPDAFASEDVEPLATAFAAALVDADLAGVMQVVDAEMRSGTGAITFCVLLTVHLDWLDATSMRCFEHHGVDRTIEQIDAFVATIPEVPESLLPLAEVEATAYECHPQLPAAPEPCARVVAEEWLTMRYRRELGDEACQYVADWAHVDLVSGALLDCHVQGACESTG